MNMEPTKLSSPQAAASKSAASVKETLAFVLFPSSSHQTSKNGDTSSSSHGSNNLWIFILGCLSAIGNGAIHPILAYMIGQIFKDLSGTATNGLGPIRELAYMFMVLGAYGLVAGTLQTWSFEWISYRATMALRLQWFAALVRQDAAYFDVNNVSGMAGQMGPASNKFRRGMGRKFGQGIQFATTGLGGIAYAIYACWPVALVVLAILPLCGASAFMVLTLNQTRGARAATAYQQAGSVAYAAVSAIRTVVSLNAVPTLIQKYTSATADAYRQNTSVLIKEGLANGSMLGSFMILYFCFILAGAYIIYRDVEDIGCDPSGAVPGAATCRFAGSDVLGAMFGVAFAAQGASQLGSFAESFSLARVALFDALQVMNRTVGSPEEVVYESNKEHHGNAIADQNINPTDGTLNGTHELVVSKILPKYEIDSSSGTGLKPTDVQGRIRFQDVVFSYPTRPRENVLKGLTTGIEPGQTVAFVGPSGSGKSTVVALLERFYDPHSGSIELDGINLKDINVAHLRSTMGYVGQEPTLFATSIRANIQYGNPDASFEDIQEAARLANAHDFIESFPDGYDTQVGDKGSQLSGGQKQRIAIARVLVKKQLRLLILDEATSALDSESEIVVQDALDNILEKKKVTTIIIAHRLSTIRGCDVINVLVEGAIAESGNHSDLMAQNGYYRKLVEKQDGTAGDGMSASSSAGDLPALGTEVSLQDSNATPHISFKDVSFSYPTRPNKSVLNSFTLDIARGSTVALVGPSGGGKSTVVGLIERFYDVDSGAVEHDGFDVKTLNVKWHREQIGYVGQEATLFNDTIANNIAYGAPHATRADIEEACKLSNAHDFIMEFSDGYDTQVGERGTQLSGGQKQRIAIARAIVSKPRLLILDESTSALDSASEAIVQAAIDKLTSTKDQTCIIIAHRLSTVRNADNIAFIANGKVEEQGTHDELMALSHGRYKRLFDASKRDTTMTSAKLAMRSDTSKLSDEQDINWESRFEENEANAFSAKRARQMAGPEMGYICIGAIGALLVGSVFPAWGLVFAETIFLVFQPVLPCSDALGNAPPPFESCDEYWQDVADNMKGDSFVISSYWIILLCACLVGFTMNIWGFGMSSERLNKRVRDSAFTSLIRQEIAYFDKRSVGTITSQLQDDASRLHAFSGEPIRSLITALSSVVVGVTLGFIYMWPFALVSLACIPFLGFATSMEMKTMLGEDEGDTTGTSNNGSSASASTTTSSSGTAGTTNKEKPSDPGGIVVETLLNMRTVSAMCLESQRRLDYENALVSAEPNAHMTCFTEGLLSGLSMFIQQWVNALQIWWGGYLIANYSGTYQFKDFLIANFAVFFSLFGLGTAFQDVSDRKLVEKSAGRIFYLMDLKSNIDPLSEAGVVPTKSSGTSKPGSMGAV